MHISVLGPLDVRNDDGESVTIGGARLRALLIRLALDPGRPVPAERLIDAVWGEDSPVGAANALQSLVSRLRRHLPCGLDSGPAGYVLRVRREDVDAHEFTTLAIRGRRLLGERDPAAAAEVLGRALALWRGPALVDTADAPFATGPAARLAEQRLGAIEDRVQARLALGDGNGLAAELEQLTREHPLRERLYGLLIRALHGEGRRAEALTLYQGLRERLADELGIDPSPDLEAAYLAVLRGGEPSHGEANPLDTSGRSPRRTPTPQPAAPQAPSAACPPAARPAPGNLTARLTTFVGRDDEVRRVARLLDESRLVTVVGPGGAGKTRLSTEVGARLAACGEDVDGGVWFVELAPVLDPMDLPQAVLGALGRREVGVLEAHAGAGARDIVDRLAELLSQRPTVLILDNCEHLVASAAAFAGRLLARAPGLRVLATSREPLGIDGEMLCPLGPLAIPPVGATPSEAGAYAAVRLFADRARAVRPDLAIDADTIDAVVEICRRLDGQPLAIELAAARTRSMTPAKIAERLDDRFRLLTGGSRTALPRHQTLRAVVAWSWELLEAPERAALRRLSVFAGGTTLAAAEAILPEDDGGHDGDGFTSVDVLDLLAGLVDKSLVDVVDVVDAAGNGETRYRLLETIQAFAAEQLAAAAESERTAARHAAWFVAFAEDADAALRGVGQLAAMSALGAEHDNLAAVLRHAVDREDADTATRLVGGLSWFWAMRGNHAEAHVWGHEALTMPGPVSPDLHAVLASALAFHTLHTFAAGELNPALRAYARARRLLRGNTSPSAVETTLFVDMLAAVVRGDNRAMGVVLARADEVGDAWTQALARLMRGHFAVNLGRPAEAMRNLGDARDRFAALGDHWGRSSAISGLAELHMYTGDFDAALAAVDEALELLVMLQSEDDVPHLLLRRGMIHARAGHTELAREMMRAIADHAALQSTTTATLFSETGMAELARLLGDFDEAAERYERALVALPRSHMVAPQLSAMLYLGRAHVALGRGDIDTADAELHIAKGFAAVSRDMPILGSYVEAMAALAAARGHREDAATWLGAARVVRGHPELSDHDAERVRADLELLMGVAAFNVPFEAGKAMSLDETLALVLPNETFTPLRPDET